MLRWPGFRGLVQWLGFMALLGLPFLLLGVVTHEVAFMMSAYVGDWIACATALGLCIALAERRERRVTAARKDALRG